MSKTIIHRFGIGFQIQRFHYRDEKANMGFKSAHAPLTVGYHKGKFVFNIHRVAENCSLPPRGWYCTLKEGHAGPCPTVPKWWCHPITWWKFRI